MFSLNLFIMSTLRGMIGSYPDFQVQEYALNWYSKGKLTEDDLAVVEEWIVKLHTIPEETDDIPADEEMGVIPEESETETNKR